jgi:hypothetical protein
MPISVACPGCGKRLKGKDELAGRRVKCPSCAHGFSIPSLGTNLEQTHRTPKLRDHSPDAARAIRDPTATGTAVLSHSAPVSGRFKLWSWFVTGTLGILLASVLYFMFATRSNAEALRASLSEAQQRVDTLASKNSKLKEEADKWASEAREASGTRQRLEQDLAALEADTRTAQSTLDKLAGQISAADATIQRIKQARADDEIQARQLQKSWKANNAARIAQIQPLVPRKRPVSRAIRVTIKELVSNPDKFEGKEIVVRGAVSEMTETREARGKKEGRITIVDEDGKEIVILRPGGISSQIRGIVSAQGVFDGDLIDASPPGSVKYVGRR